MDLFIWLVFKNYIELIISCIIKWEAYVKAVTAAV